MLSADIPSGGARPRILNRQAGQRAAGWSRNASRRPHPARSPRSARPRRPPERACGASGREPHGSCRRHFCYPYASWMHHVTRRCLIIWLSPDARPDPMSERRDLRFGHASALKQDSISSSHHTFCRIAGFRNCSSAAQECAPASEAR